MKRKLSMICYVLSAVSLITGAAFHGYRLHPENAERYNIGVKTGIAMAVSFGIFLIAGIILTIIDKKKRGSSYDK